MFLHQPVILPHSKLIHFKYNKYKRIHKLCWYSIQVAFLTNKKITRSSCYKIMITFVPVDLIWFAHLSIIAVDQQHYPVTILNELCSHENCRRTISNAFHCLCMYSWILWLKGDYMLEPSERSQVALCVTCCTWNILIYMRGLDSSARSRNDLSHLQHQAESIWKCNWITVETIPYTYWTQSNELTPVNIYIYIYETRGHHLKKIPIRFVIKTRNHCVSPRVGLYTAWFWLINLSRSVLCFVYLCLWCPRGEWV